MEQQKPVDYDALAAAVQAGDVDYDALAAEVSAGPRRAADAPELRGYPGLQRLVEGAESGSIVTGAPAAIAQGGTKLIQGLARRLYGGLLKPAKGLKDSFGDAKEIAGTLLDERAAISKGGVEKMTKRLAESRSNAMGMVKAAEDAGTQGVIAKDVVSEFAPVVKELRKRVDIGQANELGQVGQRGKRILATTARTGGDIPLTRSQALKETAQDAASGAYRARERGLQKQLSADDMLDEAVAKGFRKGIERKVPGVDVQNARTQKLIGGRNAVEDAVEREANNNMLGGGRDWAALLAGITGTGATGGNPLAGAGAAAAMRMLATPSTGSRIAIGMNEASKLGLDDAVQRALMVAMSQGSHPQ
jgi:hypothetical protein